MPLPNWEQDIQSTCDYCFSKAIIVTWDNTEEPAASKKENYFCAECFGDKVEKIIDETSVFLKGFKWIQDITGLWDEDDQTYGSPDKVFEI